MSGRGIKMDGGGFEGAGGEVAGEVSRGSMEEGGRNMKEDGGDEDSG